MPAGGSLAHRQEMGRRDWKNHMAILQGQFKYISGGEGSCQPLGWFSEPRQEMEEGGLAWSFHLNKKKVTSLISMTLDNNENSMQRTDISYPLICALLF